MSAAGIGVLTLGLLCCLGVRAAQAQTASQPETPVMEQPLLMHILFNQLEGRTDGSESAFRWDGEGWLGTDLNRLWLKSEGFANGNGTVSDGDLEALYDRPLSRFRYFDGQVGIREDVASGPPRTWAALGIEGLAPNFFEFEPTLYVRDGGHVAGRINASYDLLITQRLVAQPQLEMNFYSASDPQRGLGAGLSDLDTGLRLRYEIRRKFAPYLGFAYTRDFGGTASFSRRMGESIANADLVFGLRVWY